MTSKKTVDLSTTLAGMPLSCCIYNASGPRSGTSTALAKVAASASGAVLTKSATLQAQTGNPQPRTWHAPNGWASFNSEGLPNNGIDYYVDATTLSESLGAEDTSNVNPKKPYIVSLSGKTLQDNLTMLDRIAAAPTKSQIASIELNLACPNVIGKPIIAYDFAQMKEILVAVAKKYQTQKGLLPPLGIKLPPYLDLDHIKSAATLVNEHKAVVKYVVTINTVGNALAVDETADMPVISSNNGLAGMSGPAVFYTALANVRQLRLYLDPEVDLVGVGGISTGLDAYRMLLAGAAAVQVATVHWKEGPSCFDRLATELAAVLDSKGYVSVTEARGQLKAWSKEGAALARQQAKDGATTTSLASAGSKSASTGEDASFYKMVSLVLAVLVAILCADKFSGFLP